MNTNHNRLTLTEASEGYIQHLAVLNRSPRTLESRTFQYAKFLDWCDLRGLEYADEITYKLLLGFQKYLHRYKKRNGELMIVASQHAILSSIKNLFCWARRQGHLLVDPSESLDLPKLPARPLPNRGLSAAEVEKLFKTPDINTKLGLRNRAILAVLYSTGIRREELCKLDIRDIDFSEQSLRVQGKGGVERMTILGGAACHWLQLYLKQSRPELERGSAGHALFLNKNGQRIATKGMSHLMNGIFKLAGVEKLGSTHLWRHTFCTQLVTDGCNLRHAQALMGHTTLAYISRYSSLDLTDLKAAHAKHHPAA